MPIVASAGQTIYAANINTIGLVGSVVSTGSNGTVTSGTTETVDAVLGTLTFTALASRTYRINLHGRGLSGSVTADRFSVKFRYTIDGSTPTASSTLADHDHAYLIGAVTGTNGVSTFSYQALIVPGAATVKVVVTTTRTVGTGTATPVGACQFWAEAI